MVRTDFRHVRHHSFTSTRGQSSFCFYATTGIFSHKIKCCGLFYPLKVNHYTPNDGRTRRTCRYLIHKCWVGHKHPQVDVDGRQHAALQLILSKLHRVYIVDLQDQTVEGTVSHVLVYSWCDAASSQTAPVPRRIVWSQNITAFLRGGDTSTSVSMPSE